MARLDKSVLARWRANADREVFLTASHELTDSNLFEEQDEKSIEGSWITLEETGKRGNDNEEEEEEDDEDEDEDEDEDDDEDETEGILRYITKRPADINASLNTILTKEPQDRKAQQVLFMDVSNSSSLASSTSSNSLRKPLKRGKVKSESEVTNNYFFIGIIAGLSFSAGYAFGNSRRQ